MRLVGTEARKTYEKKIESGFFAKYMSGIGLDIGFSGYTPGVVPILETAIGVDKDFPNYDGIHLPFPDESQDYVFSSHCLEHISDYTTVIRDWYRVLKTGGHLVIMVPHQFLYEKKQSPPSLWNGDHKRFYTPASLLQEIELSLDANSYRVVHLRDNDDDYNYSIPPNKHADGAYEIELVIKKINKPAWRVKTPQN